MSKSNEILETLEELGIDVDKHRRSNVSINYPKDYSKESVEEQVKAIQKVIKDIHSHSTYFLNKYQIIFTYSFLITI